MAEPAAAAPAGDKDFRKQAGGTSPGLFVYAVLATLALLAAACLPAMLEPSPTVAPTAGPTPSVTPTASPTIVWFPPTATPAPLPGAQPSPTAFPLPVLGDLLVADGFDDPDLWTLLQGTRGSAALGVDELTIVLNEPGYYLSVNRVDLYLTDFFLELRAATSLCAGEDQYGLLLRAASPSDFYRFSLSCDGRFRLDLIRGGTASAPLGWTASAAVPRNAPGSVRIQVLVQGDQMSFYLNDVFQATVSTPVLPGGTIGLFARSAGDNAVTVNFSELRIFDVIE